MRHIIHSRIIITTFNINVNKYVFNYKRIILIWHFIIEDVILFREHNSEY